MALKEAVKTNLALIIGLLLPVVLIIGFLVMSNLPDTLMDPPRYDFVFSADDYSAGNSNIPVMLRLVVKEGTLYAQYVRVKEGSGYGSWKKLYVRNAATGNVSQITLPYPADAASITDMREEVVKELEGKKLDTTLQSPDGYELSYGSYSHSGLVNEIFWGSSRHEARLRKGSSSVRLLREDGVAGYYYGGLQFVGWVVQ